MSESNRFLILGTAGHIDHGKTALVKLLTGIDTDRLKEEKSRGISIDLGFAHLDLPGGISCGIVDVPGHERFVKNMLAGACGFDAMMLVIAADEGVMPQTREHLDILDLLGVRRGLVALTKIDMVEPDWLDLVTESVGEYLADRGFGAFPIHPVSSKTGEGKDEILAALAGMLVEVERRPTERQARLPVDRAFVVEGFGTVVTGTLWQGTIREGDALRIEPGGTETRARSLEVHGEAVAVARAGQRAALALAGVERSRAPRGSWVLAPGTLVPSHMLDVRLRVLDDASRPLVHRQRIRFHLGASEILGRLVLLEGETIEPGAEGLAQIRLEAAALADRGDRFVLRSYSPARALAGGTVILPAPPKRQRRAAWIVDDLRREESGSPEDRLMAVLQAAPGGVASPGKLAAPTGLHEEATAATLQALVEAGRVVRLEDDTVVARSVVLRLEDRMIELLEANQEESPLRWGMGRGELKSRLGKSFSAALFEHLTRELQASGRVSQKEDRLRFGEAAMALTAEQEARVNRVRQELEAGGVSPPSLKELQGKHGQDTLEILEHLTFQGVAVKVAPELFLLAKARTQVLEWLKGFFQSHDELTVAQLREAWGMSRKYSVPLLESFDREGWTRRVGDVRVPGRAWESPTTT